MKMNIIKFLYYIKMINPWKVKISVFYFGVHRKIFIKSNEMFVFKRKKLYFQNIEIMFKA